MHLRDEPELLQDELQEVQSLLEAAVLCNDAALRHQTHSGDTLSDTWVPEGSPTEAALLTAGLKAGVSYQTLRQANPRVATVPFDSKHKFMASVCLQQQQQQLQRLMEQQQHKLQDKLMQQQQQESKDGNMVQQQQQQQQEYGTVMAASNAAAAAPATSVVARGAGGAGVHVMYVKGAPDRLVPLCKYQLGSRTSSRTSSSSASSPSSSSSTSCLMPVDLHFWQEEQEKLSSQGLRVLGVCR